MDRGDWQVTVHGVAKSQTRVKQSSTHSWEALIPLFCIEILTTVLRMDWE